MSRVRILHTPTRPDLGRQAGEAIYVRGEALTVRPVYVCVTVGDYGDPITPAEHAELQVALTRLGGRSPTGEPHAVAPALAPNLTYISVPLHWAAP